MNTIKINDITLRDILQNINPEAMDKKKLLGILEYYSSLEYDTLEIMGGSSFERILQTRLGMNPFQLSSFIKSIIPSIPLQILIGARNLIGLEMYDENIIKKFIKECIKSGISVFRVYDSLNDIENFKFTVSEILKSGAECQGTIIYDELMEPSYYREASKKLENMGCSSICIKDAESTMVPSRAAGLFSILSEASSVPVYFSATNLRGLQTLNYYQAAVNGCNGFDLSFLPSSYNDFTPTVFSFLLSLKESDISYRLGYRRITELGEHIKKNAYPFIKHGLFSTKFILDHASRTLLPKWLITDINNQLAELGEIESLDTVLEEVSIIKSEIGYPSLSTPVGQIIGSQAILNSVVSDTRWEISCDEIKKLVKGYYGKLPREINRAVLGKILPSEEKGMDHSLSYEGAVYEDCRRELKKYTEREDDILSYCFFPEKTAGYLKGRVDGKDSKNQESEKVNIIKETSEGESGYVHLSGLRKLDIEKIKEITSIVESSRIDEIKLELDGIKISINNTSRSDGRETQENITAGSTGPISDSRIPSGETIIEVKSPVVGTFYSSSALEDPPFVKSGDRVKKGDTLFIIEAMKHMNRISSETDGIVDRILVQNEEAVEYNQTVMVIKKD
jgi:oxaloacetate decarboxylase (Na+ extruding) subunit alpha